MQLLGFTVAAMIVFLVVYALDMGGAVSALAFLLVLFIGALLHAWRPLVEWVRGPAAKL